MVHFGNRAVSLEQFGVPSAFVLSADAFEEAKKLKVKEALCYLGMSFYPSSLPQAQAYGRCGSPGANRQYGNPHRGSQD